MSATKASQTEPEAATTRGADDPRARRLRIASYALAGAAVASFTITLASSLRGHQMEKECNSPRGCSDADRERGKLLYRAVNVSPIVGGVFLTAATITLVSGLLRGASRDSAKLSLGTFADAHGAGLSAWGRW